MDELWTKYLEIKDSSDAAAKLSVLMECLKQEDDKTLRRVAAHDLGDMFYMGRGVPQNKERGKQLMKIAADMGHGPAMNLYGQMLTHDGDLESITYFCMALNEGELMAAKNLAELYAACSKNGASQVCTAIDAGVSEVARIQIEDKPEDENGKSSLVLALIGLYGLGGKCGISVAQGEEYLQRSVARGNSMASIIAESPELKSPATVSSFNPYKEKESAPAVKDEKVSKDSKDNFDKSYASTDSAPLQGDVVDSSTTLEKESDPMTTADWLKFGGIVLGGAVILRLIGIPLLIGIAIVLFVIFKFVK